MKLLIVDNHDSFTYNLVQLVEEAGVCHFDVVASHLIDSDASSQYDKILFSPGPGLPDEFPAMKQLLDRYKNRKSFLGICLGHQAIAEYFGATLINLPKVVHGQQKTVYQKEKDFLFALLPGSFDVGLYHSWLVNPDTIPSGLIVTAQTDDHRVMALRHKKFDIRGVQFHPESIMTPHGKQMIENWLGKNQRAGYL